MLPARSRPGRTWLAPGALLLVLLSVAVSVMAQTAQTGRMHPKSDSVRSQTLPDGTRVTELIGNAQLTSDDLFLSGDLGRIYSDLHELDVVGDVYLRTDSLSLWCDSLHIWQVSSKGEAFGQVRIETQDGSRGFGQRAVYRRNRNWLKLVGNARVLQDQQMVAGDSIVIDRPAGTLESFGNVVVVDNENDATVRGEHAIFDQDTGVGVVDSVPVLRMRQGDGPLSEVTAETMIFDRANGAQTAIGDVDFRQGITRAHADTARILDQNLLVLSGSPAVEQQGRVMQGREIRIWSVDGKVDHIEVYDGATLSDSTPDSLARDFSNIPLANTLSGDTLRINFEEGLITRTVAHGNAHSTYLPEDQESVVSVNEVAGDEIDISFAGGQVDEVLVSGGVEGTYRFYERPAPADIDRVALDSLAALADSLVALGDSLATDALARGPTVDFATSAQTVQYIGETTRFDVPGQRIDILGDSRVQNGTLILLADQIHFDTEARELLAEDDDNVRLIDTDSELIGERMGYLFDPQTGAVANGATRFGDGFYQGEEIRRIDKSTMLVERGTFTSCDLAEPHYHFSARKMKLKVGENVVARQISMRISNIPVIVLPFYYKDLKSGRRSGILFPNVNIGVSSRDGRYIRDLGYYWATNEYTDFRFELDYNERRETTFKIENVYNRRYSFDGRARFEYLRKFEEDQRSNEWKFTSEHRQPELWGDWRASAKIDVSSKDVTRTNLSSNHNRDLIDGQLYSTASMSRSFDNGSSVNFSFARRQYPNADDGDPINDARISEFEVPLSLSFKSTPLVGGLKRPGQNPVANFFRDFTWSQGYTTRYDQVRREAFESDAVAANVRMGLSWAPDKVGPIRVTSSASFGDNWKYTQSEKLGYVSYTAPDSSVIDETIRDPAQDVLVDESDQRIDLGISNSASTDVYGFFAPHIGSLRGIKHKMTASASWNLRPGIAGQQDRSQNFGFNLGNEISLKIVDHQDRRTPAETAAGEAQAGDDAPVEESEESVRKLEQFIRWNLATALNPEAPSGQQWTDITSNVYLRPGITDAISFSVAQRIDPYSFDILSTVFSSDLRMRGGMDLGGNQRVREEPKNPLLEQLDPPAVDSTKVGELDPSDPRYDELQRLEDLDQWLDGGDQNVIPWELYLRGSLNRGRDSAGNTTVRTNLSTSASVALPGSWKFSYSANFDVVTGEFTNQFWRLSRPLHCWELEFNRGLADGEDFGISLYLADIRDLRLDRGDRARQSSFSGGYGGF